MVGKLASVKASRVKIPLCSGKSDRAIIFSYAVLATSATCLDSTVSEREFTSSESSDDRIVCTTSRRESFMLFAYTFLLVRVVPGSCPVSYTHLTLPTSDLV